MNLGRVGRRFWWWFKSFFQKQQKLILFASVAGILIFVLLKNIVPLLPQFKPRERIGVVGQYTLNTLPQNLAANLGRGLFKLTDSGEVEPDLAQGFKVLDKDTRYLVYLSADSVWNDQTPINSADLEFSLPDVELAFPDERTIEFKLTQPFSPFLSLLTRPVFKNKTIGAGDYSIAKIEWQGPYLKRLRLNGADQNLDYRFYPSHSAAWLGFRLGEVDQLENLIINPLDETWQSKVKVSAGLNRQTYLAILFNLTDGQLSNKSLRQALAYAIKTKSADQDSRALSPLSPNSWAYNPKVKPYDFNPKQAVELFDKFQEESSVSGQLSLTLGTSTSFLSLAESIARDWQETLDINVHVKTVNSLEPEWQAILAAQEIPPDPDQHAFWHSTQSTNLTHYSDLKVDKLLEDGRQIADPAIRKEIYQDFQRFLVEDSPAIFLSHPMTYTISRK